MTTYKCKICKGGNLKELIVIENAPQGAQFIPTASELKIDKPLVLNLCQCTQCGTVQLKNKTVTYYKNSIRSPLISNNMRKMRIEQFSKFIKDNQLENKKILEIGCSNGDYVKIFETLGLNAYGIEFSEKGLDECRQKGLKVEKLYLDKPNIKIKDSPFDAFCIFNFLEHFPDPNIPLRCIWNNLGKYGVGLVEVPNFDMILQKKLFLEFIIDHLFYFTTDTLSFLLNKNGFEVITMEPIWHDYILSAIVQKRELINLSPMLNELSNLVSNMMNFLTRGQTAIWGASHQCFSLLSLLPSIKNILYIVDDVPFKQNRYSPLSHIPIVSSDALFQKPPKQLIIMAGSYSDDIIAKIKNMPFLSCCKILVVRDNLLESVND